MSTVVINEPIVSAEWLREHIDSSNLIILNATIPSVTSLNSSKEHQQIPNARFFDIKKKFSMVDAKFPNTFPTEIQFRDEARNLGIHSDNAIVVYDEKGIYSSPRAFWLFKAYGHNNIAVLNGGFPEWKNKNYITETKQHNITYKKGNFVPKYDDDAMSFYEDIVSVSRNTSSIIIDARSKNRFDGLDPEPRKGLRSGTIPNSINLPYTSLLRDGKLKPNSELKTTFSKLARNEDQLYFSCGSGITACILALAATCIGYKNGSVYDGSWTEYGSLTKNDNTMNWTKDELIAYILLFAANSDYEESNLERNVIISKVDMQTFSNIHTEFDADNDYQSIQKIQEGLKVHKYSTKDLNVLFADIKSLFYADGEFDALERHMFLYLKKIVS